MPMLWWWICVNRKNFAKDMWWMPSISPTRNWRNMVDLDKARPVVLVDKMGQHSAAAGRTLMQAEFQVSRLNGGMSEWTASNLPVVKGS